MDNDGDSDGDLLEYKQTHVVATGTTTDAALMDEIEALGVFLVTRNDDGTTTIETVFQNTEAMSSYDPILMALTGRIADRAEDAAVERHAVQVQDPERALQAFASLDDTEPFESDDMESIGHIIRYLAQDGFAFTIENRTEYEYVGLL